MILMIIRKLIAAACIACIVFATWHIAKPVPKGLAYKSSEIEVAQVEFIHDLTYIKQASDLSKERIFEQNLFNKVYAMIDQADQFIVLDFFLFNDDYERNQTFPNVSAQLTQHLITAMKTRDVKVVFITDPINTFYGTYSNPFIEELKSNGAEVVTTDLSKLRDSNPLYSGFYRLMIQPFGVSKKGWIENPFSPDSPKVSASGFMKMLNFKANHRKIAITDKGVMALSANPHDGSGYHSNIGLYIEDPDFIKAALEAEMPIIRFSGGKSEINKWTSPLTKVKTETSYHAQLLTEKSIVNSILSDIQNTHSGDTIDIGVFYFSHRPLIASLKDAAKRGVQIRIILDPNKDAFGMEKNGIPNRQVARELSSATKDAIKIRWYLTHGEQFHSKYIHIKTKQESILYGGSCNFTRRNFNNYNLENMIRVRGTSSQAVFSTANDWFERIWTNKDGVYTGDLSAYDDKSVVKIIIYRIMEFTGLSTF